MEVSPGNSGDLPTESIQSSIVDQGKTLATELKELAGGNIGSKEIVGVK